MMFSYRKNKFGNKKVRVDGMTFDSKKEYARWCDLQLLQRAGKISDLQRQLLFPLHDNVYDEEGNKIFGKIGYRADFVYLENGKLVVEDVKGYRTPEYLHKKRDMYEKYGILIRET